MDKDEGKDNIGNRPNAVDCECSLLSGNEKRGALNEGGLAALVGEDLAVLL